ncbi:MBL fold metallo-hydrolase [Burkholderia gladioli]|uniref:MBL fold metallo-hydrolase n=1 Tax=Burkholderia gladioli TaxID=28095 RepID=UPI003F791CB8
MAQELLYLKGDVQAEPLFQCWYAWSYLIPPASAARYLTDHYQRILESYVNGPQFHAHASKDPKMIGGPFVDLGGQRVAEVKALIEQTRANRAELFALSAALRDLGRGLQTGARGDSLMPLYATVPDPLKGLVELAYDAGHHASYRVIEPLMYRSPYYDDGAQSFLLSVTTGDHRPFVLSTPRLEDTNSFNWRIPFEDARVDAFFRLRTEPRSWDEIREIVGDAGDKEALLRSFFTTRAPRRARPFDGDGARWRYFGHACMMLETRETTLLLDPVISYAYDADPPRFTHDDLPERIDYVVITHNHQDHVMLETLLYLRHRIDTIVLPRSGGGSLHDMSLKLALQRIGFRRVIELDELETLDFAGGSITGIPFLGEHGDLSIRSKLAHLIRVGRHSMLFAADSCGIEKKLYENIRSAVGPIDTLLIGLECEGAPMSWVYGPLMTQPIERGLDQRRRLSGSTCAQSLAMVDALGCSSVYVYAMGQEPWLGHVMGLKYAPDSPPIVESDQLIATCRERGMRSERLLYSKEILLEA